MPFLFSIHHLPTVVASQAAIPAELEAAIPQQQSGYVVTVDNMLKMLSIALRLKNRLPVVVMGSCFCIVYLHIYYNMLILNLDAFTHGYHVHV